MTDGPFTNLKLSSGWKRFAEAVQSDAVDMEQRRALASNALVREILMDGTDFLLANLQAYGSQQQLDIDPINSVESIFNSHQKTPFADTLQKQIVFRLADQMSPDSAFAQALTATVGGQVVEAKNRIEEECIRARDSGEMRQDQFEQTVGQAKVAFDGLNKEAICNAVRVGDKNAFKDAAKKKEGLDEGPDL